MAYLKKTEDGTVVERHGSEETPFEYVCGDGIHEGLDRAVMTMRKGEEAAVKITTTSAAASLHYQIKLIDFTKVDDQIFKSHFQKH